MKYAEWRPNDSMAHDQAARRSYHELELARWRARLGVPLVLRPRSY
jgi:hypothetical protein